MPEKVARASGVISTGNAPFAFTPVTMRVMLSWNALAVTSLSLCPNWMNVQSPAFRRELIAPNRLPLPAKLPELSPESA